MRTAVTFALGAATGAAAARLLTTADTRKLKDQASSRASGAASAVSSQARYAAGTIKGAAHTVTPSRSDEPMDDQTLADRVRSEIFRDDDAPKGSVSVDVQAGVAYLRGEVADQGWIDRLGNETRRVHGVNGVKNLLHAPGTPAPVAEPRHLAAEQFKR